jgi:hypothetical protein
VSRGLVLNWNSFFSGLVSLKMLFLCPSLVESSETEVNNTLNRNSRRDSSIISASRTKKKES